VDVCVLWVSCVVR